MSVCLSTSISFITVTSSSTQSGTGFHSMLHNITPLWICETYSLHPLSSIGWQEPTTWLWWTVSQKAWMYRWINYISSVYMRDMGHILGSVHAVFRRVILTYLPTDSIEGLFSSPASVAFCWHCSCHCSPVWWFSWERQSQLTWAQALESTLWKEINDPF